MYTEGQILTTHSGSKTIKLLSAVPKDERAPWMKSMNSRDQWWYATIIQGKGINKQRPYRGQTEPRVLLH